MILGERGKGRRQSGIIQLAIHLVGQHDEIMLLRELQDLQNLFAVQRRARRIAREVEEHRLRLRRHLLLQRGDRQPELVFDACLDADRNRVREPDRRRVGDEARLVVEHLVARRAERADRKVDRLGDADRDKDLLLPVEVRGEAPREIAVDRLPKRRRTEIRGVVRAAVLQTGHRRAGDVPGRVEVGLAHAEGHDVLRLRDDVEELPNSALRQFRDMRRDSGFQAHSILHLMPTPYFISSSASFSSCASLSALSAPLIVTTVSQNAMSLDFSNMPFITFAAIGAHEPFSMRPIVRFW